jgi:hypothetical protein
MVRQAVEARANPVDVAIEKCAGFVEIALQWKRDDHCAARAAYAKCKTSRARMTANFQLRTDIFKTHRA